VKINCDGSYIEGTKHAIVRIMARNETGEMIACRGVVVQARSAKEAELLAV